MFSVNFKYFVLVIYYRMSLSLEILRRRKDDSEDIWTKNILDRYILRPKTDEFENLSLATFAAEYDVVLNKNGSKTENVQENLFQETDSYSNNLLSGESTDVAPKLIPLIDKTAYIKKRKTSAIIRYPKFSFEKETERYFTNLICLSVPHRLQEFDFEEYGGSENYYNQALVNNEPIPKIINRERCKYERNGDKAFEAWQEVKESNVNRDIWLEIATNNEEERLQDNNESGHETVSEESEYEEDVMPDLAHVERARQCNSDLSMGVEHIKATISHEKAQKIMRSLNTQQSQIFYFIRKWCIEKKMVTIKSHFQFLYLEVEALEKVIQ